MLDESSGNYLGKLESSVWGDVFVLFFRESGVRFGKGPKDGSRSLGIDLGEVQGMISRVQGVMEEGFRGRL